MLYLLIKFFTHDSPRSYIDDKDINNFKKNSAGNWKFNGIEKEFLEKYESDEYQKLIKEIMEYEYEGNNNKEKKESIELTDMEINVNNKNDNLINNNESKKKNLKKRKSSFFVSLKYPSLRYI